MKKRKKEKTKRKKKIYINVLIALDKFHGIKL